MFCGSSTPGAYVWEGLHSDRAPREGETPTLSTTASTPTNNQALLDWVERWSAILAPKRVEWCDGSDAQYEEQCQRLVESGTFTPLNPAKRPDSFYCRSDPGDVAPRGGPDIHLLQGCWRCRSYQQLGRPRGDATGTAQVLHGSDARTGALRHSLLHGTTWQSNRPDWRATDRLSLCSSVDADHDSHGDSCTRRARRDRSVRAMPALGRPAARCGRTGCPLAL